MKITVIHPSLSRSKQAAATVRNWLLKAQYPENIEYILSLDDTDDIHAYRVAFEEVKNMHGFTGWVISDNKSAMDAINNAAVTASGDLFIVASDDFDCPNHWDATLLSFLEGKKDFIVKTDDGCQPWIITLPIMDRAYYDRFGYIYYPGYKHMFCDTEMTHVADLLGRKLRLPIKFPHNHYTQKQGQPFDGVNQKNDSTWSQGEALYLQRIKDNFGLTDTPGKLDCADHHKQWLQNKGAWQTA